MYGDDILYMLVRRRQTNLNTIKINEPTIKIGRYLERKNVMAKSMKIGARGGETGNNILRLKNKHITLG